MQLKKIAVWLMVAVPVGGQAYQINPEVDVDALLRIKPLKSKYGQWLEKMPRQVHEQMALRSYACALAGKTDAASCTEQVDPGDIARATRKALLWGVRWNDDPNNFLSSEFAHDPLTWYYWLADAKERAASISNIDPLEYRSHYGDLQYFHAMARHGDTAQQTQDRVVEWVHFLHDVATGEIAPDTRLSALSDQYPFVGAFAGTSKMRWTVWRLFTAAGKSSISTVTGSDVVDIPTLATGSLLHTIEDSFSRAHTERQEVAPYAVKAWLDYAAQDGSCHNRQDVQPAWTLGQQPVLMGAMAVKMILDKRKWREVEPYFRKTVFPLAEDARAADGGGYAQCPKSA